jgi:hypothetical protein
MRTTTLTVERNYRIDNTDQYMKARLNLTVEIEEGETAQQVGLAAIKQLDEIFCIAYPFVEPSLNFHIERQVTKTTYVGDVYPQTNYSDKELEKINKGTIEEQIMACSTEQELKSFDLLARMNPKLSGVYDHRLKDLTQK